MTVQTLRNGREPRPDGGSVLRIALVMGGLEIGGTETQVCRLATELHRCGHVVEVIAMCRGGPLEARLAEAGVPFRVASFVGLTYRSPSSRPSARVAVGSLRRLWSYWTDLWEFRPDICHVFLPGACNLTLPGAAIGRIPVRIAGRRSLSSELDIRPQDRPLQKAALLASHAITANSDAVAADAALTDQVPLDQLRVIPNGVDIPNEQCDIRRNPAVGMIVANLIAYKGHTDLIRAMQLMQHPPLIRAIGDGPERINLQALAYASGLGDRLLFEGSIPNAGRLFQEVQFAILASHQEGMPNAVLEAMSFGVPVIATSVGGVPELIQHDVTGLLVPPRAPRQLAEAISRVSTDTELRVRLGAAARQRAEQYSWDRCVNAHLGLYVDLLARHSRNARTRSRA